MELLTPQKIRSDKREEVTLVQRNLAAAAEEEDRIVRSLNLTRDAAEEAKIEIAAELREAEGKAATRKAVLAEEIALAERRLAAAKEPIDHLREAAERRMTEAIAKEEFTAKKEAELSAQKVTLDEREKAQGNTDAALKVREDALGPKEAAQAQRERRIVASYEALATAQTEHDAKVRTDEERLAGVAAQNDTDAKANETERIRLEEKEKLYQQKDREIKDRYATLERAAAEIEEKKKAAAKL